MNSRTARITADDEDAAQLKFGKEFQDAQALLIAEVKVLLDANDEKRRTEGDDDASASASIASSEFVSDSIKRKTVEYCEKFSRFTDKQTIKEIRQLFPSDKFHQFEAAQLANLGCETVDEAKTLIPRQDLAKREDELDDNQLQDILDQMSNLRKFQASMSMGGLY
ncbi:DNA-directed RNA polymerase II subunit rpb4 [Entophlyctis luteolus]|nr:DNA-directed RNA polymerase II subunit rpb4 [Entophlyctis luteolus]